ncbi:MAG: tyrosine-type recombinase/integrase, partial [Acidobacteria bacterium]|nr:tyrosine-type recombinase/integrase [Acidobacteriota bacterium]
HASAASYWFDRFIKDLSVIRPTNTVRAYRQDIARWLAFCTASSVDALNARPTDIIQFVRAERERPTRSDQTVGARTLVRRLSALRQWYEFLMLEPEQTGVRRNPVPVGSSLCAAVGIVSGQPALLRYDRPRPQTLSPDEIDRFISHLTATTHRDRAIVWLLKDGAVRISEALALRIPDIHWAGKRVTVHATKSRNSRVVPLSDEALAALSNYLRLERPKSLAHDYVFVCLGRRNFGQPFRYRAWVYVCEQARKHADAPRVHAHAFRHTCATNLAEAGMPMDALQRQLGHRHIETTLIYNEVRDSRLQREYHQAMAEASQIKLSNKDDEKKKEATR